MSMLLTQYHLQVPNNDNTDISKIHLFCKLKNPFQFQRFIVDLPTTGQTGYINNYYLIFS